MKKIIDMLGIPKLEDIDYMSNQEYSFIQSINEEENNNYNKLKEILLINNNEINFSSINCNIKKIILEIIIKSICYNRKKRISLDEMINQVDYLYDRYIKEKPMKIDAMNIIYRDNLLQLNAPITNISLNPYKSNKSTFNSLNSNSCYDENNNNNETENDNDINNEEYEKYIQDKKNINSFLLFSCAKEAFDPENLKNNIALYISIGFIVVQIILLMIYSLYRKKRKTKKSESNPPKTDKIGNFSISDDFEEDEKGDVEQKIQKKEIITHERKTLEDDDEDDEEGEDV